MGEVDVDTLTRRKFLVRGGITAGAALAAGATTIGLTDVLTAAKHDPRPGDASVLVLVTLYGGNDGLGTLIPTGDTADYKVYRDARPDLAYTEDEVLPLGGGLGLNPALKGFKKLWDGKQLAVVRGVSYPVPDRSHFRSMAIWQTASPVTSVPTGWLGRWLDVSGPDPLRAIAIGEALPPLLAGATCAGATLPLGGVALPKPLRAAAPRLGSPASGEPALEARAAASLHDLLRVEQRFGSTLAKKPQPPAEPDAPTNGASAGGQGALGAQLDVVAACIGAGAPTRAYSVSLGGFDTHADEKATQTRLLGSVDAAISSFLEKVRGKRVVAAVYSEFGRRVAANGNQGTDHGTSGPVFVLGEAVAGGFYGEEPSLTDLDDGDLKVTTDFRDVYATLLDKVLDTDPARVLGGQPRQLSFL